MKLSEDRLYSAINEFIDRVIMPLGSNMSLSEQFFFGAKMGIVKRKSLFFSMQALAFSLNHAIVFPNEGDDFP